MPGVAVWRCLGGVAVGDVKFVSGVQLSHRPAEGQRQIHVTSELP
jgi:hypothetical protein